MAFNIPIGEIFEITDSENIKRIFRANMVEFSVKDGATRIAGTNKWNASNDVVVMNSHDILPPKKEIKALVKVVFEEQAGSSWVPVKFDGKVVEETMETSFTTGEAPDYIPASNVEYSYPVAGQYNFYPKEYNKGFIKLKKGQPYLFVNDPKWIRKARITEDVNHQRFVETDYSYDGGVNQVNYTIPDGLSLATIYRFELLNIPRYNQVLDANVEKVSRELVEGDEGVAQLTTKKLEGSVELLETESIYGAEFRTSKYETFVEKMKSLTIKYVVSFNVNPVANIHQIIGIVNLNEAFDNYELNNSESSKKLIQIEAITQSNIWYNKLVYPLVYEEYPLINKFRITTRNIEEFGLPPVWDNLINQSSKNIFISDVGEIIGNTSEGQYKSLIFNLMNSMKSDYWDLQNQAAYYMSVNKFSNESLDRIALSHFPVFSLGEYKLNLKYFIPGVINESSSYLLTLNNK